MTRRRLLLTLPALALLGGCQGKELSILGYSTEPPFDADVRSVYIPTFKSIAFVTNPHRGVEADVTEAVIQELNRRRSPIRVVSDPARADTELIGTITQLQLVVLNRNIQNYAREIEFVIAAELVWRDLRSGQVLTNPKKAKRPEAQPFDPSLPETPPPAPEPLAIPVTLTATGRLLPELGESNVSAQQMAAKRLAAQIVNLMEKPW